MKRNDTDTGPADAPLRILILDDSALDAELALEELKLAGTVCVARRVDAEAAFREALASFRPDVILLDYQVPGFGGEEALRIAREVDAAVPVIFVSGAIGEEGAVELVKQGATDYVLKDRLVRLPFAIQRALAEAADHAARIRAEEALRQLNLELERRVTVRTLELSTKNRQLEEGLRLAREFQTALLPHDLPVIPTGARPEDSAVRFLSFYRPHGVVSGDFYDVVRLSEQSLGVLVCDVMGHDVRAALVTTMLRALVQEQRPEAEDPGALLTHINRSLTAMFLQADTTLFVTAVYLVIDLAAGELRFANAGHPNPLQVRRREGDVEPLQMEGRRGPALGLIPDAVYTTTTGSIEPGDFLMLFTDGLFEIEDPDGHEAFSRRRLLEAARSRAGLTASEMFHGILQEIREASPEAGFGDDVCLLGVELRAAA